MMVDLDGICEDVDDSADTLFCPGGICDESVGMDGRGAALIGCPGS